MSQCRDMTQSFSPLSRMNECRENSKCTGPLLLECTKTVYKRSLVERLDRPLMVVLLTLRVIYHMGEDSPGSAPPEARKVRINSSVTLRLMSSLRSAPPSRRRRGAPVRRRFMELVLDLDTPALLCGLQDCITDDGVAIAILECRTIWCYFLVVDDCVEQMGDLVHKRVLPANNVTLRPPVRPERMIGFGHEHIGEPPRFPGRSVFPV